MTVFNQNPLGTSKENIRIFIFTFSPTNEKQETRRPTEEPDDEEECFIFEKIKFCRKTTRRRSHGKRGGIKPIQHRKQLFGAARGTRQAR